LLVAVVVRLLGEVEEGKWSAEKKMRSKAQK
jgi:hypothetical protein